MNHNHVSPPPSLWGRIEERHYRRLWQRALAASPGYPTGRFKGRGLVFCVGGERLFVNLWINLCLLRRALKCSLPIEIWYFGEGELTPAMASLLEPFDVRIVNGETFSQALPRAKWRGFALKTLAVLHSSFEEVLFLDADSYPVRDPSFLFDEWPYRWAGACFWPDIWDTNSQSGIWSVLNLPFLKEMEWESGQMVIDKRRAWQSLCLVDHLTHHFPFYYRHVYGDKMIFYVAWRKLDQPYAMTKHPARLAVASNGRKLLNQFDFQGKLLFQHRTTADWSLTGQNEGPKSVHEDISREFLEELRSKWPESERSCRPNRSGQRRHFPWWQGLVALWPTTLSGKPEKESVPSRRQDEKWDEMAYHALLSPHTASPQRMGVGLEALGNSTESEARALVRFFAALIFVDPRLAGMLPENLPAEGTALQRPWEELQSFVALAATRKDKTGLLAVRGNLMSVDALPCLEEDEISRIQKLMVILSDSSSGIWQEWNEFWKNLPNLPPKEVQRALPPVSKPWSIRTSPARVLVVTPLKNASELAEIYCDHLSRLNYPPQLLSLGMLESDSREQTYEAFDHALVALRAKWSRINLWKHDYHYQIPHGFSRWHPQIQVQRRAILAQSRNELLRRALKDEDWVLWLDVDVIDYPRDIIEQLLSYGKDILHPHCVMEYGGITFDRNGWREHGRVIMDALRGCELLAPLDAVGGTMLFIRADLHRRGLIFPETLYGADNPRVRPPDQRWDADRPGELETEGLGIMALDMNVQPWGLPDLEVLHRKK